MSRSKFQNVEQYEPLMQWLDLHDARNVWFLSPNPGFVGSAPVVEGWRIGSALVLVILHPDRQGKPGGWDLAVSPNTTDIKATFDDIEARLGLEVAR